MMSFKINLWETSLGRQYEASHCQAIAELHTTSRTSS